jgi:putative chitinase
VLHPINAKKKKMNYSNLNSKLPLSVVAELPDVINKFKIVNPLRLAHFLAQCSHESGNFRLVRENLNYSAQGLRATFPKYFPTDALAQQYARNPQAIGNRVYANRMGNGDEKSGDGFKYSGKGYIQLTGKSNYKVFSDFIGEDCVANPELIATKYPLTSAGFFFNKNGLWAICDRGDTSDVVKSVTKRVNGGLIGLNDRIHHFNQFKSLVA